MCACALRPKAIDYIESILELLVYIGILCANGWHSKHVNTGFSLNQYLPSVFFSSSPFFATLHFNASFLFVSK